MTCSIAGCDRPHHCKGYCEMHYSRSRKGALGGSEPSRRPKGSGAIRDELGHKFCANCSTWKPETEFAVRTGRGDGLQTHCRRCKSDATRVRKWGLRADQIEDLLFQQGGCAICGAQNPDAGWWCVDHDHSCCSGTSSCGKCLRGILCISCNMGLGQFKENIESLSQAINYIYEWNSYPLDVV